MDDDKKEMSDAERQAELHWDYLGGVMIAHCIPLPVIEVCGHHYKIAFIHGWKHGQEAMNAKANS